MDLMAFSIHILKTKKLFCSSSAFATVTFYALFMACYGHVQLDQVTTQRKVQGMLLRFLLSVGCEVTCRDGRLKPFEVVL